MKKMLFFAIVIVVMFIGAKTTVALDFPRGLATNQTYISAMIKCRGDIIEPEKEFGLEPVFLCVMLTLVFILYAVPILATKIKK